MSPTVIRVDSTEPAVSPVDLRSPTDARIPSLSRGPTSHDFVLSRFLDACQLSVPRLSLLPASKNLHKKGQIAGPASAVDILREPAARPKAATRLAWRMTWARPEEMPCFCGGSRRQQSPRSWSL